MGESKHGRVAMLTQSPDAPPRSEAKRPRSEPSEAETRAFFADLRARLWRRTAKSAIAPATVTGPDSTIEPPAVATLESPEVNERIAVAALADQASHSTSLSASPSAAPSASPSAATLQAHLANAEQDRLDALEEAECASEDRDGYRRELARVRADVRRLEAELRAERHEHAETRQRLAHAAASAAARIADDAGLALATATAEARLRHQAADYERRIADLTRQAALSEQRAREARETADRVLVGAMLGAHQAARVLAEHGVEVKS